MAITQLNYQVKHELDLTPNGATRTWARIGAGITNADPENSETVNDYTYMDNNGFSETAVEGSKYSVSFSGHSFPADPVQAYVSALQFELGDSRNTNYRSYDKAGDMKSGAVTISDILVGGGDPNSRTDFTFKVNFVGKPSYTPKAAATALIATVSAGTVPGTTRFTVTPAVGNTLGYKLLSATQGIVYGGSYVENFISYVSASNIVAAVGQYLCMYEIDSSKHVVAYLEEVLASDDIDT